MSAVVAQRSAVAAGRESPAAAPSTAVPQPSLPAEPLESLAERRVLLPGGLLDAQGRAHRVVRLRPLTGADEELLADRAGEGGAAQVTALLARVIERIDGLAGSGEAQPVTSALVGAMLVGDRDYLLLRLRQMDVGDNVHQVLRCREPACGKKADVEFLVSELPVRRAERLLPRYALTLDGGSHPLALTLRLPTGDDQQAVAELARSNVAAANTRLFTRIARFADEADAPPADDSARETRMRALPLAARRQLAEFIEQVAPGPDLYIDIACPHCGADLGFDFDLNSFFLPSSR